MHTNKKLHISKKMKSNNKMNNKKMNTTYKKVSIFNCNGGMGILHLSLTIAIVLGTVIFPWMVDSGLYASRIMQAKSAMRAAINAAVQEIDNEDSTYGLSKGFSETTGMLQTMDITFNEELCRKVFGQMFQSASGINEEKIREYLTLVLVIPKAAGIQYIVLRGDSRNSGEVESSNDIEEVVNSNLNFGEIDARYTIYVEGNNRTNSFSDRPYLIAVLKDYEIGGLMSRRNYTFVGFKAARINRRQ